MKINHYPLSMISNPLHLNHCLTVLFLIVIQSLHGQETIQKKAPESLLKQGDSLIEIWELDKANIQYNLAKKIYYKNEDWENYAMVLNKLGNVNIKADRHNDAYANALTAIKILQSHNIIGSLAENKAYFIIGYYYDFVEFDFDKALEYYNKALAIKNGDKHKIDAFLARVYNGIAVLHSKNGFYEKALPFYEKALEISKKVNGEFSSHVADIYSNMGLNYRVFGNFEKAILYQKKSIEIDIELNGESNPDVAMAYSNISETYEYVFDLGKAIYYGEKALSIALSKFNEEHPFTAEVYQRLSSQYLKLDKPKKAEEYAKRSLTISENMLGLEHPELIFPINTLSAVSSYFDDNKRAIAYAKRALDICLKVYDENHIRTAQAYLALSNYITKEDKIAESLIYQKKAIQIYQKIYDSEDHVAIASTYEAIADNYLKIKSYGKSLESYQKALDIIGQTKPKNKIREGYLLNKIGKFYIAKGDMKKANTCIDGAIAQLINDPEPQFSDDLFLTQRLLINLYETKNNLLKLTLKESRPLDYMDKATALNLKIDSIIGGIQYTTQNQTDRIAFSESLSNFYDRTSLLYLTNGSTENNVANAFYFIEKGRFRVLKELLNQKKAFVFGDVPKKIKKLEDSLKSKKSFYKSKLTNVNKNAPIDTEAYTKKLFLTNRRYDSLLKVIEENHPTYFGYNYKTPIVTLDELSEQLEEQEIVVQFAYLDEQLYVFRISKNNQIVQKIEIQNLVEKINQFNRAIIKKEISQFKVLSRDLYGKLLENILNTDLVNNLTIVPDGPLWHLNFELLLTEEEGSNNPKNLPFLIKKFPLSYENSATSYFLNKQQKSKKVNECLAFSYLGSFNTSEGQKLRLSGFRNSTTDLPGTRSEIKEISKIFNGEYFYGSAASESAFKQYAGHYSVLHLALHGEVNNDKPEESKLLFTKVRDTIEDGNLYAHEIFNLNLSAEMAVLSACNTGIGQLTSGEGIIGLGSAFQYAGTKSLVMSKWEVSDVTAPILMKYFYQNLEKGMSKSKAMQQAKLKFLNGAKGDQTHPYYWSSFFILGDNGPLIFKKSIEWYHYLLLALVLIIRIPRGSASGVAL